MSCDFEELKFDITESRDVSLFGAFPYGGTVRFSVKIKGSASVGCPVMVIHADGWNGGECVAHRLEFTDREDDTVGGYALFSREIAMADIAGLCGVGGDGLFYYHYAVKIGESVEYLGGERPTKLQRLGGSAGERQLLIYRDGYKTSDSFRRGVVYHIFVDRFRRSGKCRVKRGAVLNADWEHGVPQFAEYRGADVSNNVFFGGDLFGVCEKLDYISKLGVRTIYLSPVFDAYSNHKYDTGDYLSVDQMFGGDEALVKLCGEAKKYGIDVILDGVFNHTGDNSVYFNKYGSYDSLGAYQSHASPFFEWYSFLRYPDEYKCWWGIKVLPRVDSGHAGFKKFICDTVVDKWMKAGVAGWRLDVADELDNGFLTNFREAVKIRNPDGVVIGEVWEDASDKVSYGYRRKYLRGGQLDSVMNYPLRDAVIGYVKDGGCERLRLCTESAYRRYPKMCSDNLMNFLGTHDTERILTVLGGVGGEGKTNKELSTLVMSDEEKKLAVRKLRLAYSIISALPGVPCVFYGDEAGVEGYHDPFCRKPFPWNDINRELLWTYRKFGGIRRDRGVLHDGLFRIISLTPECFVYIREPYSDGADKESIVVAACRAGKVRLCFNEEVMLIDDIPEYGREFILYANEAEYFSCKPGDNAVPEVKLVE